MSEPDARPEIPISSPDRSPNQSPPTFVDTAYAALNAHRAERDQQPRYKSWMKQDSQPKPWPHSPALPWHKEYSQLDRKCGRVLVIDFLRADESQNRKRKVVAQELDCLESLKELYKHPRRDKDGNLRLLHVQNAPWATKFLLRKFNIDGRDELVGSNFGRYARASKSDRRGGKLFPNAKSWAVQHDPWRGIGKTSFGFEYLKEYEVADPTAEDHILDEKMMELDGYEDEESPVYGSNVYIQRLACYIQHKEDPPTPPFDSANGISNPYSLHRRRTDEAERRPGKHYLPQLSSLDNEDAIIIFDNSRSGSFEDCLLPARSHWETRWRRLPFYLAYEARELGGNDDLLGRQCARMILDDVFRALINRWEGLLDACHTHISVLEDKIYEQPADETRAPELWKNSSLWLQLEKLTTAHMAVVREMRARLRELVADITQPSNIGQSGGSSNDSTGLVHEDDWLQQIPGDLDRIALTVEEDLVKPTQALISLLYQSVSIRDSRLSLQIDTSMWRLSWITFIFLPLTFMVGFFGMNVDTFSDNPSMKWYFITSVPFMFIVLVGWYVMKHILARQRQTPYQRGTYESFFHGLAIRYPRLWSRVGPREYIVPRTRMDKWKWWLIQRWTRPERTIKAGQDNADTAAPSSLSRWSRIKMSLIRHWTDRLTTFGCQTDEELFDLGEDSDIEQANGGTLANALIGAAELLTVPGQPVASAVLGKVEAERMERQQQRPSQSPASRKPSPEAKADTAEISVSAPTEVANDLSTYLQVNATNVEPRRPVVYNVASAGPRGRAGRPTSSGGGSSWSRNSSVLIEEEDPRWINQLAKQGKGWYWRPASQSPAGRSSSAAGLGDDAAAVAAGPNGEDVDARRNSSSSGVSGGWPSGIRFTIDERVGARRPNSTASLPQPSPPLKHSPVSGSGGGGGGSSGSGPTNTVEEVPRSPRPSPSPLAINMTNANSLESLNDQSQVERQQQAEESNTGPQIRAETDAEAGANADDDAETDRLPTPRANQEYDHQQQQQQPSSPPYDSDNNHPDRDDGSSTPTPPSAAPPQGLGLDVDLDFDVSLAHSATTNTTASSSAPSSNDEAIRAAEETAGRG